MLQFWLSEQTTATHNYDSGMEVAAWSPLFHPEPDFLKEWSLFVVSTSSEVYNPTTLP